MRRAANLLPSVVEAIGSTPLVELARITQGLDGTILAKLDYLNPGFSKSDLCYLKQDHIDGYLDVSDEDAISTARELAKKEGIFAGFSSGANVAAAIELLKGPLAGKTIATIINDSGLKYLSTDLWE